MHPYQSRKSGFLPANVLTALWLVILCLQMNTASGAKKKVLFIGNSYTYVNDLPQLTAAVAASAGDTLLFDSETSGGATLYAHSISQPTKSKIMQGGWDYVVLQEQSQAPSLPDNQVQLGVFPYARYLDSLIHLYNGCATTLFYMTWGRKNGDAVNCAGYPSWPYICTYEGMDSLLRLRYIMMADSNDAALSPVGAVWHYIRVHYPSIELYQSDESHPSEAGSYAAACSFYTAIFRKDPVGIGYNYTLSASAAANIRTAAKAVVYDSLLYWQIGAYDPAAHYNYTIGTGYQVSFNNTSLNASAYNWDFGDGQTSALQNPVHSYTSAGAYNVTLIATHCGRADSLQSTIGVYPAGVAQNALPDIVISPNPAGALLTLSSSGFLSGEYAINICDNLGRTVYDGKSKASSLQRIDLSHLDDGVYILTLSLHGETISRHKFIKN